MQKNCTYLVSLCLHEQDGDTIVDEWSQFECKFKDEDLKILGR